MKAKQTNFVIKILYSFKIFDIENSGNLTKNNYIKNKSLFNKKKTNSQIVDYSNDNSKNDTKANNDETNKDKNKNIFHLKKIISLIIIIIINMIIKH